MLASLFFVSAHKDSATRHGCALRSACRGGLQPGGLRPGPTEPAGETKSFCPIASLSHPFSPVLNRSHPLQHPKRTRVRLFRAESGAFFSFSLFCGCKIFRIFFVHSADRLHRLKSLVIPLSRDVSFFT